MIRVAHFVCVHFSAVLRLVQRIQKQRKRFVEK
jgi:hypothetical protein